MPGPKFTEGFAAAGEPGRTMDGVGAGLAAARGVVAGEAGGDAAGMVMLRSSLVFPSSMISGPGLALIVLA